MTGKTEGGLENLIFQLHASSVAFFGKATGRAVTTFPYSVLGARIRTILCADFNLSNDGVDIFAGSATKSTFKITKFMNLSLESTKDVE